MPFVGTSHIPDLHIFDDFCMNDISVHIDFQVHYANASICASLPTSTHHLSYSNWNRLSFETKKKKRASAVQELSSKNHKIRCHIRSSRIRFVLVTQTLT